MRLISVEIVVICAAGWLAGCGTAHSDDQDGDVLPEVADEGGEVRDDGAACEAGLDPCGTGCVDTQTDPDNCGDCGHACADGTHATGVCSGGSCGLRCDPGWVDLDGSPGCEVECTPASPPTETCNGLDDDCNGESDDPFECVHDATESCTTSCGTAGTRRCDDACTWQCIPPAETCDSLDQDCNGVADEGTYGALWDVVGAEPTAPRVVLYFSPAIGSEDVALGYVRTTTATTRVGDALLQRLALLDGSLIGTAIRLSTAADARGIRASVSPSFATFVWDTGDDVDAGGESIILRAAVLGASFTLHPQAVADTSSTDISMMPSVSRAQAVDSAVAAWVELSGGATQLRLAVVSDSEAPAVADMGTVVSPAPPDAPDVSISADTTVGVVWVSGTPGDVLLARFDMTLVASGESINLSSSTTNSTLPRMAASDSRFMIVWQEEGAGIQAAAVGTDGTVSVPATTIVPGSVRRPTIAPDLIGGFAVAYETDTGTEVIRMSDDAALAGAPLSFPGGIRPEIAAIPGGGLVVAYELEGRVRVARLGCSP